MGSAVHEAIEQVLTQYPDLREEEQLHFRFQQALDRDEYGYPDSMHDNVMTCIANAARFIADREQKESGFEIRGIEKDHTFSVNRPDLSYPFRGIMDVATNNEIWDWKTGNRREGEEQIQGALYLAAYTNMYGEVPEAIRFVYLKNREQGLISRTDSDGNEFWSKQKQPDGWEEVITLSKQILKAWEKDRFPAKPGDICFFCDHEGFCSASSVGVGNESGEAFWMS